MQTCLLDTGSTFIYAPIFPFRSILYYMDDILSSFCNTKKQHSPFSLIFAIIIPLVYVLHLLYTSNAHFLDVDLSHDDSGKICSDIHFKLMAGNSYLHQKSCHHPAWKKNIPTCQFCRLQRNSTLKKDYRSQGLILKQQFIQKGYSGESMIGPDTTGPVGQILSTQNWVSVHREFLTEILEY